MAKQRKPRRVGNVRTLLIVGEGIHDKAFLGHMKGLYDGRETGQVIKLASSDGGSPRDILKSAQKQKEAAYDKRYVLMDSDVAISQQDRAFAEKNKVEIIQSEPICLEGMLLTVLGVPNGNTGQSCKSKLRPYMGGCPTKKESYQRSFPKPVLDDTRCAPITKLKKLMQNDES